MPPSAPESGLPAAAGGVWAWGPLALALLITVVVTLDPLILGYAGGQPDPVLETLAMCAMCVGYVRGLGYIPRQRGWQWVFSSAACYLSLALALLRMAANRN